MQRQSPCPACKQSQRYEYVVVAVLYAVVVCNAVMLWFLPYSGDDWGYLSTFHGPCVFSDSWYDYPQWLKQHIKFNNARIFDLQLPWLLALPRAVLTLLSTAAVGVLYVFSLKSAGVMRSRAWALLMIAALTWALPWWDAATVWACIVNYVWAAAFVIAAWWLIAREWPLGGWRQVGAVVVAFVAGCSHEAAGLPLAAALWMWLLWRRKAVRWSFSAILPILALTAGAVVVTFNPGNLLRAGTAIEPDDPAGVLLLKNIPVVIIMCVMMVLTALTRRRGAVVELVRSPVGALALAAVLSGVISVASGIVGRSGWFAELYALIVIFSLAARLYRPGGPLTITAVVIAAVVVVQLCAASAVQMRMGREFDEFTDLYKKSDTGVVYYDAMLEDPIGGILTLGRFKAMPDADDVFQQLTFATYHDADCHIPIVLPTAMKAAPRFDTALPEGAYLYTTDRERLPIYLIDNHAGSQSVVVPVAVPPGDTLYYTTARILDWGDR